MEVKVNLRTLVFVGLQRGEVSGFTLVITGGVGGAGNRAVNATPTFSPFSSSTGTMLILVRNADDICTVFIRVCVTDGSTVNFFATSSVDAVQLRNAGQVGIEFETGSLRMVIPVFKKGSGRAARPAGYQQLVSSSSPVPPLESSRRGWRWLSVLSRELSGR
jgi:hypothetical protein